MRDPLKSEMKTPPQNSHVDWIALRNAVQTNMITIICERAGGQLHVSHTAERVDAPPETAVEEAGRVHREVARLPRGARLAAPVAARLPDGHAEVSAGKR